MRLAESSPEQPHHGITIKYLCRCSEKELGRNRYTGSKGCLCGWACHWVTQVENWGSRSLSVGPRREGRKLALYYKSILLGSFSSRAEHFGFWVPCGWNTPLTTLYLFKPEFYQPPIGRQPSKMSGISSDPPSWSSLFLPPIWILRVLSRTQGKEGPQGSSFC